jgi:hypothetical protein
MNEPAWEQHLEHLPDELAKLRAKNLLLHSRLAKAIRRADKATQQRDEAREQLRQAMGELRWHRANERRKSVRS